MSGDVLIQAIQARSFKRASGYRRRKVKLAFEHWDAATSYICRPTGWRITEMRP